MATTTRGRTQTAKPRNDAYTGLLFISFLALVVSSVLLYLDYSQYDGTKPPKPNIPAPSSVAPAPPPSATPEASAPMGDAAPKP